MDAIWLLVSCSWKALALIALGALAIRVWPKTSAAERYSSWTALLLALLLLPVLSLLWATVSLPFGGNDFAERALLVPAAGITITVTGDAAASLPWTYLIPALWALGAVAVLGRFAAGLMASRRFVRNATVWTPNLEGWNNDIPVLRSPEAAIPLAVGIVRPSIVLPESATSWSADTLLRVLTHEAAHIRREDGLWRLAATVVSAIYWFHPAVWYALRALELEREQACDDAVLASGQTPSAYAEDLVAFARRAVPKAIPGSAIPMATPSQLEARVAAILDEQKQRQPLRRTTLMKYALAIMALLLPLSAVQSFAQADRTTDSLAAALPDLEAVTQQASRTATPEQRAEIQSAIRGLQEKIAQRSSAEANARPAATPAAQSNEPPKRIRVGGNVMEAKVREKVQPEYPQSAKEDGIQGTVRLDVIITETGNVRNIKVVRSPDERLAKASVEAVSQWKYEPTLLNGNPVEVVTVVDVNFKLQ